MKGTAIVTGASGGIGKAICIELVTKGYHVAGLYLNNEREADLLNREYGIDFYRADLSNSEDIRKVSEKIIKKYRNISVLINNAGVTKQKLFTALTPYEISDIINLNLTGSMLLTREIAPVMVRNKSGRIINISSVWGVFGGSCETHYSASKAGLIGFTKALSRELGPSNITVNCIAPGFIDTKMNSSLNKEDKIAFINDISLQRAGRPEDVAFLTEFLCSKKADYITGQIINVDGGM